jgi:hypothetical protein
MNKFRLFKRADDGKEMAAGAAGFKDRPYYFRPCSMAVPW